ncbi:hypothetical protein [Cetobacterium sp.]|uniref:hypothetical protein n=1 Tax=Cetobacterium sp. TaxID=2071632 RepID=UPI003EE5C75F
MFLVLIVLLIFLIVDRRECCGRSDDNKRGKSYNVILKLTVIALIVCIVYFLIGRFFYSNLFMMRGLNGFLIGC